MSPLVIGSADIKTAVERSRPMLGHGVCSFPNCSANSDGGPCTYYSGTADRCLNCDHPYSYHA